MKVLVIKNISFKSISGDQVHIRSGSYIHVDVKEMIGYALGYHFCIESNEIALIH